MEELEDVGGAEADFGVVRGLNGFVLWFDSDLDPDGRVSLSTAPAATPTHWHQELLLLPSTYTFEEPVACRASIRLRRHPYWRRHYVLSVSGRCVRVDDGSVVCSFERQFAHHRHAPRPPPAQ